MRARSYAVIAIMLASLPRPASAGKLGAVRSETQGSSSSGSSDSSSSSSYGSSSSGDSDDTSGCCSGIGDAMVEGYRANVRRLYARYPYAPGSRGFVHIVEPDDVNRPGHKVAGSFALDGALLGHNLGRAGLDFHLMVRRFGLGLDFSPHLETRPLDALSLGSAALLVAPLLLPRWQIYAGVGANVMVDGRTLPAEQRSDAAGINVTIRTTILPIRPIVIRGRFDFGRLGAAPAVLGRATVGAMVRRFELYGGYEARRIGSVVLHGPTAGVRVWF